MFIIQGCNMDTISTIGIIAISALQLIYIFVQHFFYNKQLKELRENMISIETQLNDKHSVINELQEYINKNNE